MCLKVSKSGEIIVLVLLSAHVKKVSVSHMQNFFNDAKDTFWILLNYFFFFYHDTTKELVPGVTSKFGKGGKFLAGSFDFFYESMQSQI